MAKKRTRGWWSCPRIAPKRAQVSVGSIPEGVAWYFSGALVRLPAMRCQKFGRDSRQLAIYCLMLGGQNGNPGYEAKFSVLAENVRHHIKEEENEVFPKAKDAAIDFEALTQKMVDRKEKLLANGVPKVAEAVMVGAMHGKGDSPAQATEKAKAHQPKRSDN